ncbi:protein At-4/1 isoform X2 [Canna indica]|uniref:Protein At-4/1 isoform X2 n=1 Tax=Canna indica TaxID=4628 RepID=A0AAQ3KX12_9LILI|nr:protein At-4/1 isoform X2 [Canna indica]
MKPRGLKLWKPLAMILKQMTYRAKCQSLTEEIGKTNSKLIGLEEEHRKTIDMLKQENEKKIHDLEMQVSCALHKQASDQVMINQLQQELAVHENHTMMITSNFEKHAADLQSKYESEIQELKYCLLAEQEEKYKLQLELKNAENELQVIKKQQEKQQRDSISLHHVETLKQKIMKLRKENESLKRQFTSSKFDHT